MFDNLVLFIKSYFILLMILCLICFISMFIVVKKILKIRIADKNEISDTLINTFAKRYFYYLLLWIISYVLDIIGFGQQWWEIVKIIFIMVMYSFFSHLITRTFKTPGGCNYILAKNLSLVMTVEMLLFLVMTISDNNNLFSIVLSCLWGKWCWLDCGLHESMKKVFDDVKIMFSEESMKKYYAVYLTAFCTTIIFKIICAILLAFIPELSLGDGYAITGLILLISIVLIMEIICVYNKIKGKNSDIIVD